MILFATLLLALPLALQADDGPESKAPTADAPTATPFKSTSKGDLRYIWQLPEDYSADEPRQMTVILHGTGGDYRWGYWNNFSDHHMKLNPLRSNDILISVDGTSPGANDSRLFLGQKGDVDRFHDFLVEIREQFAVDKIFLYGHSQGSFFVVHFAAEHPEMLGGVVAHASGVWSWSKVGRKMKDLPVLFLHGTADPVVPYRQSVGGGRDYLEGKGLDLVALLRLPGYSHWPNSMRASEGLDWCEAMSSDNPATVLQLAQQLSQHKGPDSYQYEITPAFSLSRQVLKRLLGDGDRAMDSVPKDIAHEAEKLAAAIEAQGAKVVKVLSKSYGKKIALAKKAPLGMLISVREDYRGVASVEEWYASIGYDKLLKKQQKKVQKIHTVWWKSEDPAEIFEVTVDLIGDTFLIEGFQWNMKAKMEEWHKSAKSLKINKKTVAKYADFELWADGWKLGNKEYTKLWKKWKD